MAVHRTLNQDTVTAIKQPHMFCENQEENESRKEQANTTAPEIINPVNPSSVIPEESEEAVSEMASSPRRTHLEKNDSPSKRFRYLETNKNIENRPPPPTFSLQNYTSVPSSVKPVSKWDGKRDSEMREMQK